MQLFLTSSDILDENTTQYISEFLNRDPAEYKVLYITTPADIEEDKTWLEEAITSFEEGPFEITRLDIKNCSRQELRELLNFHDAIWTCGGIASYYLQIVYEIGFDKLLHKFVQNGMPYMGASMAGMILNNDLRTCIDYVGEEDPEATKYKGFGWVDFEIYPHYNETDLPEIETRFEKRNSMYLLKNGQAIGVRDGKVIEFGGSVAIY